MKFLAIIFLVLASVFAKSKEHPPHREHQAHVHGAGRLGIAFEGTKGRIDFKIPSDSIFGFEYAAKTRGDKKKRDEALRALDIKISEMIVFESGLGCKISKEKIEVVAESAKHSETVASFYVVCEKSPLGTEITFNFQKFFPNITDLDVEVVTDNLQKSVEAKKDNTKLILK